MVIVLWRLARALLAQFKLTQVLHIVGRDEVKKELEA
jgi:hypothetical protein